MLKYTDVNIELITDPDMLLMFELGIRGGLTQVCVIIKNIKICLIIFINIYIFIYIYLI